MAVILGNLVWEGVSTEPKPTAEQGALDAHVFKELDTGDSYHRRAGSWVLVKEGFSFIRATKSGRITTDGNGRFDVVFATPFISNDYTVALTCEDESESVPGFKNLSDTGFRIVTRDPATWNRKPNVVVSWVATRDYDPVPL